MCSSTSLGRKKAYILNPLNGHIYIYVPNRKKEKECIRNPAYYFFLMIKNDKEANPPSTNNKSASLCSTYHGVSLSQSSSTSSRIHVSSSLSAKDTFLGAWFGFISGFGLDESTGVVLVFVWWRLDEDLRTESGGVAVLGDGDGESVVFV